MSPSGEIVRSIYERWNRNDGDLALDLFDPEVEIHQMARIFDSEGTFNGHAGLVRSAMELRGAFERVEWIPHESIEEGNALVVSLRIKAVGVTSGITAEATVTHLWRVDQGLVTEFSVYETTNAALRSLELGEPETG